MRIPLNAFGIGVLLASLLYLVALTQPLSARRQGARQKQRADRVLAWKLYRAALKTDDMRALKLLLRSWKLNSRNYRTAYLAGYIYHKMNRRKEAEKWYRSALRLRRCHYKALNNLGNIQLDLNRAREAERYYRRAIRCNRRFYASYYNLANLENSRNRRKRAVWYYKRTLRLNPRHYRSRHNLGVIYEALAYEARGRRKKAYLRAAYWNLKKALALKPRDALCWYSLAGFYYRQGERKKAVRAVNAALRYSRPGTELRRRIREYRAKNKL